MAASLAVGLAVLALVASELVSCRPAGRPALRSDRLDDVRTFALGLGVDPSEADVAEALGRYDLVVVDGDTDAAAIAALHRRGTLVLGYLSVGTVEPYRAWYDEARADGWLLERWDDWDEWYVDTGRAAFRARMVTEAERQVALGLDGLFLDNTDMVAEHPAQRAGMTRLVADLDRAIGTDRLLFAQNGDATVDTIAGHLDGWNREDVSQTFDRGRDGYAAVDAGDGRSAVATLRRLRSAGILVTATDYTGSATGSRVAAAVATACSAGALPFVSDLDLTRIPNPPPTCP